MVGGSAWTYPLKSLKYIKVAFMPNCRLDPISIGCTRNFGGVNHGESVNRMLSVSKVLHKESLSSPERPMRADADRVADRFGLRCGMVRPKLFAGLQPVNKETCPAQPRLITFQPPHMHVARTAYL